MLGIPFRRHPEVLVPGSLGVGRFVKIGIPSPQVMAPFVGVVEIVCGTLL
jgi:putative oxidoreductase